jgi:hypothetical protein
MENTKANTKKPGDESPVPMIVLLITIGLGAVGLVYFVVLG